MARRRAPERPNYHRQVVEQLTAAGCLRMEEKPNGAYRWYSEKTNLAFLVEADIPLTGMANAILQRAGLPPIFKKR